MMLPSNAALCSLEANNAGARIRQQWCRSHSLFGAEGIERQLNLLGHMEVL